MIDSTAFLTQARLAYAAGDYARARSQALAGAAAGEVKAMVLAGLLFERGLGGAVNEDRARQWYEAAAAETEDADALIGLARLAAGGRARLAPSDARGFLRRAMTGGSLEAAMQLGRFLGAGVGGPPDPAGAREAFRRAAEAGSAEALRELAYLELDAGEDIAALDLLRQAADAGDARAAYEAGLMWAEREGRDALTRAAGLFAQAAEGGHAPAATLYGKFLWDGVGVEQNREAAADWYRKAAEGGDAEGAFYHALMLFIAPDGAADAERAFYWAQRSRLADPAAEAGYGAQRDAILAQAAERLSPVQRQRLIEEAEADAAPPDAAPR